jgi:hypothetical protein
LIEDVIEKFELTSEQERAFRIIANHAVTPGSEQLIMYVCGMGGTGKSQVIKALMDFFKSRNESHRFVVLAPTGIAAALLHGSTYHSFLGVPIDGQTALRNETTINAQVKARLDGVEYIFLDEVSMVACGDNDKISSQLAKGFNEVELPYGGINMVFSGDFAQLPPVFGSPLYGGTCGDTVDVMYDSSRATSCHWKGTVASSDYCCDTKKEYETNNTNSTGHKTENCS